MSGACSDTSRDSGSGPARIGLTKHVQASRAFKHPARARKELLEHAKRLGGRSTLEQGSTRILGHLGNTIALEQSEHGCAYARAERALLFLRTSMLVQNTTHNADEKHQERFAVLQSQVTSIQSSYAIPTIEFLPLSLQFK